ncbi:effector-associated constant component EACC1 [Nonomuraea africana]
MDIATLVALSSGLISSVAAMVSAWFALRKSKKRSVIVIEKDGKRIELEGNASEEAIRDALGVLREGDPRD